MLKHIKVVMISSMIIPSVCAVPASVPTLDRVRKRIDNAVGNKGSVTISNLNKVRAVFGTSVQEKQLDDAEKIMDELCWSNRYDLVTTLCNLKKESNTQAIELLKDAIKTKCAGTRSPLVVFVNELNSEGGKLLDAFNMLLKAVNGGNSRLKMLFEQHARLAQNLQQLVDVADALLMG